MEARIAALELDDTAAATQAAVQKVQAACLQQLRDVKAALDKNDGTSAAQGQAAVAEKAALERKVAKLEYRVQHLLSSMEYLYDKAAKAS